MLKMSVGMVTKVLFILLLGVTSITSKCDVDDDRCKEAEKFSQLAQARCAAKYSPVCKRSPDQLNKRFLVKFVNSDDYEKDCGSVEADENNLLPDCEVKPTGRKRRDLLSKIRQKRADDEFAPKYFWNQDKPKRGCCITTRRTLPHRQSCGDSCFIVYCPLAGGYQWIDQVQCDVNDRKTTKQLGVRKRSRNGCRKTCETVYTTRTYVVTNFAPEGYFGHCFYWWLPVWFRTESVPSHCVCPHI